MSGRLAVRALKVVLADDHPLSAAGVVLALEGIEGIRFVGEASGCAELLPLIARSDPDVVLLDLCMPGVDGFACLDRIRARFPRVTIIILTGSTTREHIRLAFERGASGYILKSIDPRDLAAAIRQTVEHTVYQALPSVAEDQMPAAAADLSERELQILRAASRGRSNPEIARELWLAEQTVKFHLVKIYRKLGVGNRTEAARYAYLHGLVSGAPDV